MFFYYNKAKHIQTHHYKTTLSPALTTTQYKHIYRNTNSIYTAIYKHYLLYKNNTQAIRLPTPHQSTSASAAFPLFLIPPRHTKPTPSHPTLSNITTPGLYIENYQSISKKQTHQLNTHPFTSPTATGHLPSHQRKPSTATPSPHIISIIVIISYYVLIYNVFFDDFI